MKLILVYFLFASLFIADCEVEDDFITDFASSNYQLSDEVSHDVLWSVWSPKTYSGSNVPTIYQNRQNQYPEVNTSYGRIKGFVSITSRKHKKYAAFLGIPYATPPLGNLRFKAPIEPEPWEGVRDGTYERNTCITFGDGAAGSEDCLYLNIYTPNTSPENSSSPLVPVMVWIHGGAFIGGSSNCTLYAPDFLVDHEIVLVTLNYRLGPLGFLSLQNEEVPGNAGLKDQNAAMKWVKGNIRNFGGDPNKITIFGESAGSASVNYHILSKSSKGLFNQAIMESGTVLNPWAYTTPDLAISKAFRLGEKVGCNKRWLWTTAEDLLQCLQETSPLLLAKSQEEALTLGELFTLRPFAFLPTTEPDVEGAFITQSPWDILQSGDINKVPTIIGSNSREGLLLLPALKKYDPLGLAISLIGLDLTRFVPYYLKLMPWSNHARKIDKMIKEFYFDNRPVSIFTRGDLINLITDVQFLLPIQQTALCISRNSTAPVYNYWFTFDGDYALFKEESDLEDVPGVSHADEMGYLFNSVSLFKYYQTKDPQSPEEQTVERFTRLWTDFAKTGTPTPSTDELIPEIWEPFKPEDYKYYEIGDTLESGEGLQGDHIKFWIDVTNVVLGN